MKKISFHFGTAKYLRSRLTIIRYLHIIFKARNFYKQTQLKYWENEAKYWKNEAEYWKNKYYEEWINRYLPMITND